MSYLLMYYEAVHVSVLHVHHQVSESDTSFASSFNSIIDMGTSHLRLNPIAYSLEMTHGALLNQRLLHLFSSLNFITARYQYTALVLG